MTERENLLEPKTNRSPEEVGKEVFRLVREHGAVRVEPGDSEWDVKVFPADEES